MNVVIPFPPRLAPKEPLVALGRNGPFKATGLNVMQVVDYVMLENWTSQDAIGRGRVVLPADHNVLRDLANHLNRIADKLP
ncbi:hypothetical protein [Mesorhizobium sp. M7A.F.Ca.MR.362.00.0.0]|uniref:hypothetical protein n=1 Tax=Mesorhizobium sp. M7A.F.Ca.MR.362.00.0.0 TaxID=2496779 RepID=UPI000FD50FC8|nr:hypothetical protein [Mesorhizobium sp. M7A.F.Ca.MR.362.00.0.0]RUU78227.1 hypothetical protein EOC06_20645 [Mesorhizobium sp. M7A.F.Ca.MR.362.00.0.0]RWN95417.1 MAG: hypothetical protein EOS05_11530 [Mesorhizobium sp.]